MAYEYLMSVKIDESFPTAKDIATKITKQYGIVTTSGRLPIAFVRSFLDAKMQVAGLVRLRTASTKAFVYQNSEEIFSFLDSIFDKLRTSKALVIEILTAYGKEVYKLLYKPAVKFIRRKAVGICYDELPHLHCNFMPMESVK